MAIYFTEGFAPVLTDGLAEGLMTQLATDILASANANWELAFPNAGVDDAANLALIKNVFTLKKTLGTGTTRDVYLEFHKPEYVQEPNVDGTLLENTVNENYFYMEVVYGYGTYTDPVEIDADNDAPGTWETDKGCVRSRFSWFKSDTLSNIKSWLPVQYYLSVSDERIVVVLAGDASANKDDRLISFGYFGETKPFDVNFGADISNFAITTGSDKPPSEYLLEEEKTRYSDKTGTGVTDINMLQTYTGFPMQAHYPAFTTPDELLDKKLEGPSQYTKKYHMSPVYVFHGFDGYRGQLEGVIATDRSTVVNLDDLIHKYNATTGSEVNPDTQDTYKTFLVSAPYSMLNNATNVLYGLAVLKDTEAIV